MISELFALKSNKRYKNLTKPYIFIKTTLFYRHIAGGGEGVH